MFRVAISHSLLEQPADGQVTCRYRDNRTHALRRITLPAVKFLHRFLPHVLPRGCATVRAYGLWSPTCRRPLDQARTLLSAGPAAGAAAPAPPTVATAAVDAPQPARCPHCPGGTLRLIAVLRPYRSRSPC